MAKKSNNEKSSPEMGSLIDLSLESNHWVGTFRYSDHREYHIVAYI